MSIKFRNYTDQAGITDDYFKVRNFLLKLGYSEFTYARWDWMITHGYLDKEAISKIGIWEENNSIVGVATFDTRLGVAYCLTLADYHQLKKEMLNYSEKHLCLEDEFYITINDSDTNFQNIAKANNYIASEHTEEDAIIHLDNFSTPPQLPEGFSITSMNERYDLHQYKRVLWNGFNHEINGEGAYVFSQEEKEEAELEMNRPNVDLQLKIVIVAPNKNFAAYCGMWYDKSSDYAVIEPLATDPEFRKMGLAKAAVLEGFKRVKALGAKRVFVGSSQQFYYSIGMKPFASATLWKKSM